LAVGALLLPTLTPATARATASAELYRTESYVYGRYEARIRYAAGDGVISSFFLWKEGSEMSGAYWNELDFEKLGADCHVQTNALYGNPRSGSEQQHTMPADMCDAYHDYAFEWTPTYIAWFIDGQEIRREAGAIATAFAQNATAGMSMHFNVWPGNASFGGNFDPAILPVHQFISWIQYSSYENGNFTVQWREEFDGSSLPSGWATGSWASPYNLSTHAPANVSFVGGMAVLSLTADDATGFSGTPPPDDQDTSAAGAGTNGSGGASSTGGTPSSGGARSSGGAPSATGGGPGTNSAGANTSGASGSTSTAGSDGSGSPTSGGTNATGGAASGGTTPGSGGASTSGVDGTTGGTPPNGTAGQGEAAAPPSSSSCGCRVAGQRGGAFGAQVLLLGVVCALRRRRRSTPIAHRE
jgi:hypothetical protein